MSSSRQATFSGTKAVEQHLQFDESRLAEYLQREIDGFAGPLEVRRFKGGQSNPTYQLITPERNYVLLPHSPLFLLVRV